MSTDVSYSFGSFNTHRAAINAQYVNDSSHYLVKTMAFFNHSDNNYWIEATIPDYSTGKVGEPDDYRRFHDGYTSATGQVEVGVINKPYADKLLFGILASGNHKDIQHGVSIDNVFGEVVTRDQSVTPTLKYHKYDFLTKGLDVKVFGGYVNRNYLIVDTASRRYFWDGTFKQNNDPNIGEATWKKTYFTFKDQSYLANVNTNYSLNSNQFISLKRL